MIWRADGDEIELHVVQVVEHVAVVLVVWMGSVVVEDVVVALEDGMKLGPEEVHEGCGQGVDTTCGWQGVAIGGGDGCIGGGAGIGGGGVDVGG